MKLSTLVNVNGRVRLLALLITLLMAFSVVACGDDDKPSDNNENNTADVISDQDVTSEPDTTTDQPDTTTTTPDTTDEPDTTGSTGGAQPTDFSNLDETNGTSCETIFTCEQACTSGDTVCEDACVENASDRAKAQRVELLTCMTENCGGIPSDAFAVCINDNCRHISDACIPPQEASCLQDCTSPGDSTCPNGRVCTDLGAVVCVNPDGSVPDDAEECGNTNTCTNSAETCYTMTGGNEPTEDECDLSDPVASCAPTDQACTLTPSGFGVCDTYNPDANIDDVCSAASLCNTGQVCAGIPGEDSTCLETCNTTTSDNTCIEENAQCAPLSGGGALGICVVVAVNPDAEVGDVCDQETPCAADQLCAGIPGEASTCYQSCSVSAADICTSPEICQGLSGGGDDGICAEPQG